MIDWHQGQPALHICVCAAELSQNSLEMSGNCEARPPVRRRGSPMPWQSQPSCRTSPVCSSVTIVIVSARCSSRFCDVVAADSGSQFNWASCGVGTREQRRRWWVQRLETLSTHVPSLCDTLAPCCVDTVWLVWCSHVDCAWHLLWRTHSIPSGAGSASAVTHHHSGGPELHLGRVPTRSA